jgi:hypothetical protein
MRRAVEGEFVVAERPPILKPPHHGGCLCGAVRYRLDSPPLAINACHCLDCRKLTGASNLLMVIWAREGFCLEKGTVESWRKTADSGRQIDIMRCTTCGTRLWHEPLSSPAQIVIAAGTLDYSDWAIPSSHIWTEKARPGTHFHADALMVEGQPVSREMLMDAFAKLYGKS